MIKRYKCKSCDKKLKVESAIIIINRCYCKFHPKCFPKFVKRGKKCPNCSLEVESFDKGILTNIYALRNKLNEDSAHDES